MPVGQQLYAAPAPGDKLAVDLLIKKHPRVVVGDMSVSESKPVKLKGSGELIQAHDGVIELRVPLAVNANLAGSEIASQEDVTLSGE